MKSRKNPYEEALIEIEHGLWEQDCYVNEGAKPYEYTDEAFRACTKIFMSGLMWKIWKNREDRTLKEMSDRVESVGKQIRALVLNYTGIDTHKLF